MRGGLAHHNVQVEAVILAFDRANKAGDYALAEKIRNANPDLEAKFADHDAHAVPSV